MPGFSKNFITEQIKKEKWASKARLDEVFWENLEEWIFKRLLPDFVTELSNLIDSIITIDPDHSEKEILELVANIMVESMDASYASVRIYDPDTEQMLSYCSYPIEEKSREIHIPLEGSVVGEVVKSGEPFIVPDIIEEKLYSNKSVIKEKGVNSLMAIPFEIPRFFPHERNTTGVIQIYFPQRNRQFTALELQIAGLMSRRLGFVIAQKKILLMQRTNEKKETILKQIFSKMSSFEGVKMKDIFNRLIPELAYMINVQSCALFSVHENMKKVVLEAGYPDSISHHGIGKTFSIESEPAFELVLGLRYHEDESPYEIVTPSYVLVTDPQRSNLVSKNTKEFALNRNVNSILYIPLKFGDEITHFMTFDAVDHIKGYSAEEIEIFLFLGRELMKAQRMEHLDDILHDFKNPAIATAGFARRVNTLLEKESSLENDYKIKQYTNILMEETSRLQEMALSITSTGKEQAVNLTDVIKRRFEINKEAIKEQLRQNIDLQDGPFEDPLYIYCYPLYIERAIDNILHNATKAIPPHGGTLSVSSCREGNQAYIHVTNSGAISEDERRRLLEGEAKGRGYYITHRIIRLLKGFIDIEADENENITTVTLKLPIHDPV
ncbi:GAF domain-containing protein [Thermodesulfobacteriota bacterium]